jgi:hypothetical protein
MTPENMRLLGFGDKTHYQPSFVRTRSDPWFHHTLTAAHGVKLRLGELSSRVFGKVRRLLGRR